LGFTAKGFASRLIKDRKARVFLLSFKCLGLRQAIFLNGKVSFAREMIWD